MMKLLMAPSVKAVFLKTEEYQWKVNPCHTDSLDELKLNAANTASGA
jgi:hypothetical protein